MSTKIFTGLSFARRSFMLESFTPTHSHTLLLTGVASELWAKEVTSYPCVLLTPLFFFFFFFEPVFLVCFKCSSTGKISSQRYLHGLSIQATRSAPDHTSGDVETYLSFSSVMAASGKLLLTLCLPPFLSSSFQIHSYFPLTHIMVYARGCL